MNYFQQAFVNGSRAGGQRMMVKFQLLTFQLLPPSFMNRIDSRSLSFADCYSLMPTTGPDIAGVIDYL